MQKLVRFSKPSVHLQSAAVCTCWRLWDLAGVGPPRPQSASGSRSQAAQPLGKRDRQRLPTGNALYGTKAATQEPVRCEALREP